MGRHLIEPTRDTCRAELEKLEMQEAQLDSELEQGVDESRKMLVLYTLAVLHKDS
jgi:hypothetical protein